MNIIPKINGTVDFFSNEKIYLKNLNIIDNSNILDKSSKDLINSKFGNPLNIKTVLLPNNDNTYKIKIINGEIIIETSKDLAYNALITLFNLKDELYKDMLIIDYPKYQYREFSIDVARHFFSIDELKKLIDEAANLKLNKIHLHLSDNQGWRIECKKYPLLHEVGGKNGFYTQQELKNIVQYANIRNIEIIPEIDIPGHVGAILHSYPEFGCYNTEIELDEGYKRNDKTLCFGNDKLICFIKNLFDEILDIFPSKYIHIGCDEIDLSHNKNCPKCKDYIKKRGFNSFNDVIIDFINQVANYVFENNREVIVWNDATRYGKLNGKIILQNWFDYPFDKTNLKEFNNNRNFIFGSTYHTYFDYPMSLIPLKNTYNFQPRINNTSLEKNNILGTSSHIWTEVINDNINLEKMIFPRLIAFSENSWSNELNYTDFLNRLTLYLFELEKKGIFYTSPFEIPQDKAIEEIVEFFKRFLTSNGSNISLYQSLVGTKLVLTLLKESKHIKDIPKLTLKMIK